MFDLYANLKEGGSESGVGAMPLGGGEGEDEEGEFQVAKPLRDSLLPWMSVSDPAISIRATNNQPRV